MPPKGLLSNSPSVALLKETNFHRMAQNNPAQYYQQTPMGAAAIEGLLGTWAGQAYEQDIKPAYDAWTPQWSDLYNAPMAMAEGIGGVMKDAMDDPEDSMKMLDLASMVAGGGFGASKLFGGAPRGALGMFAGTKAKTANPKALDLAKKMESAGASRDEIWKATGEQFGQPWMNDAKGGGWKFEIDDSGAVPTEWRPDLHSQANVEWMARQNKTPVGMPASDFIEHPDLARAYWPLKSDSPDVFFDNLGDTTRGSYASNDDIIDIDMGQIMKDKGRSTGLHEMQHAIQSREGFARGGSSTQFVEAPSPKHLANPEKAARYQELLDSPARQAEIDASNKLWNDKYEPLWTRLEDNAVTAKDYDKLDGMLAKFKADTKGMFPIDEEIDALGRELGRSKWSPDDQYKRLAGEAEARNVQTRMDYPMQQRIDEAPWTTMIDVPEDELIYRMGGNGESMASALGGVVKPVAAAAKRPLSDYGRKLVKTGDRKFKVVDDRGDTAAEIWLREDMAGIADIRVKEHVRGKGLANAAMDEIEKTTGIPLKVTDNLSEQGFNMWQRRDPAQVADSLYHHKDNLLGKTASDGRVSGPIVEVRNEYVSIQPSKGITLPVRKDQLINQGLMERNGESMSGKSISGMGEVWYRGDKPGLTSFEIDNSTSSPGNIFLSSNERLAGRYAKTGRQYDIMNPPNSPEHGLYRTTVDRGNSLEIDAGGAGWDEVPVPKEMLEKFFLGTGQIDDIAAEARVMGYDSLLVRDVLDQFGDGDQLAVFNPARIKMTDALSNPQNRMGLLERNGIDAGLLGD